MLDRLAWVLKKIASIDAVAIEELIQRFINHPETSDQLMGTMDVLCERLRERLQQEATKRAVLDNFGHWIARSADSSRRNLLPALTDRLADFLDDEENWQAIDRGCVGAMGWIKNQLVDYVKSEQGQAVLKDRISQAVRQLNVTTLVQEQVMKLDTDELEKMILDNTGGNLVVIQVLGGGLGMIAGLVQVHIGFALPVLGLIALGWVAVIRNRKKYDNA